VVNTGFVLESGLRIRATEDSSGLLAHSTKWVEYWYRHFMMDDSASRDRKPDRRGGGDIVEILRAVLNYYGPLAAAASKCTYRSATQSASTSINHSRLMKP
jgi:hypothetical protein